MLGQSLTLSVDFSSGFSSAPSTVEVSVKCQMLNMKHYLPHLPLLWSVFTVQCYVVLFPCNLRSSNTKILRCYILASYQLLFRWWSLWENIFRWVWVHVTHYIFPQLFVSVSIKKISRPTRLPRLLKQSPLDRFTWGDLLALNSFQVDYDRSWSLELYKIYQE